MLDIKSYIYKKCTNINNKNQVHAEFTQQLASQTYSKRNILVFEKKVNLNIDY